MNSPEGVNWFSIIRDGDAAQFSKRFDASHTVIMAVETGVTPPGVTSAEQLAEYMKAALPNNVEKGNTLIASSEKVVTFNQLSCVRYSRKYEDSGALSATKLINIVTGLACFHPTQSKVTIDLTYSERGGGAEHSDEVRRVGDAFMSSLRFDLNKVTREDTEIFWVLSRRSNASVNQADIDKVMVRADAGERNAALNLGQLFLMRGDSKQNYELARKYLELAAADGHVGALYNLGWIYERGLGVSQDSAEAVKWYRLAADQRDGDAQLALARLYAKGEGVPRDLQQAKNWERMAANNGNKRARSNP